MSEGAKAEAGSGAGEPESAVSAAGGSDKRVEPEEAGRDARPGEKQGGGKESGNGLAAQVIGNTSVLVAVLIYMGWNYENSLLKYFSVSAFGVNIGTIEYALKGLVPLLQSGIIFFAALLVLVIVIASQAKSVVRFGITFVTKARREAASRGQEKAADHDEVRRGQEKAPNRDEVRRGPEPAVWLLILGLLITTIILPLTWLNVTNGAFDSRFAQPYHGDAQYFVLALLATGLLLSAWPVRRKGPGPLVYPLALLVAALCTLWAAGIYASQLGTDAANSFYLGLRGQTAVAVYSAQPLDLSGYGVTCLRVQPGAGYAFRCTGLRLLYVQSGTYDLLPVSWTPQSGHTYILDDSNQIRIELYYGQ